MSDKSLEDALVEAVAKVVKPQLGDREQEIFEQVRAYAERREGWTYAYRPVAYRDRLTASLPEVISLASLGTKQAGS
jgi:hypothetical protein